RAGLFFSCQRLRVSRGFQQSVRVHLYPYLGLAEGAGTAADAVSPLDKGDDPRGAGVPMALFFKYRQGFRLGVNRMGCCPAQRCTNSSQPCRDASLCVIKTIVLVPVSPSMALFRLSSVSISNALVASSKKRTGGSE